MLFLDRDSSHEHLGSHMTLISSPALFREQEHWVIFALRSTSHRVLSPQAAATPCGVYIKTHLHWVLFLHLPQLLGFY